MKRLVVAFLTAFVLLQLSACRQNVQPKDLAGKTFLYEKDGFYGEFTITLHEDGTMSYYVGSASSYIGMGTWLLEGNILTLTDNTGLPYINVFRVEQDTLIFHEEDSTNFMYLKVENEDRFFAMKTDSEQQQYP